MSVQLRPGLAPAHRAAAARLYWAAFGAKLGRVLGPEPLALRFIAQVIDESHAVSALSPDGALIGIIGFRTHQGTFVGGGLGDLQAVYGRWGGAWRFAALASLAFDGERRAMMVDGVAVAPEWRGAGIGARLIEAACAEAEARGFSHLRLDVVDENPRARALYDRLGFQVERRRRPILSGRLFGFAGASVMQRDLGARP
ncbi:GNAT family N-acetyltransferase [Pseudothioclava arenosa]|uniref:GNAT family N-acetyltransferase n=1 Tax=Pseudothioclava arenosa TaxID=1795308 RepID=UPI001FEBC45C|nr:GNAT family N-acetyltransferase [Pseudothioclava arenosa]